MKQPFQPELNKQVFIRGINKKGIAKEIDKGKTKVTYFSRDTDKRITTWFDNSQLKAYKPKEAVNKTMFNLLNETRRTGERIGESLKSIKQKLESDNTIYFAKVRPTAIIPSKRNEDGCYDIYADQLIEEMSIAPGAIKDVPTGIATAFSAKYRFDFQRERGSTGAIGLVPRCGQIDSGYRGEIFLKLQNVTDRVIIISKKFDKITYGTNEDGNFVIYPITKAVCQAALEVVPIVEEKEIPYEQLEKIPSQRGKGKLGDSGK